MVALRLDENFERLSIEYDLIIIFIQVHNDQLAYGTEEYTGELYRVNLSCSGGGLPESGCLLFKVGGNTSTVIGIICYSTK
jgi:hypothetical protein